jgi:alpha-ribazole phosphatase
MSELWLVRHGQTDWNVEGRYQGQADMPLNSTGIAQAWALAEKLAGKPFSAIFSSTLQRARQTAQILANRLGLPLHLDGRLAEIHQGDWEGMLVQEIATNYTSAWDQHNVNPANTRAPGGESVAEVAARMRAAADDIAHLYPEGHVLVVSHGLALATMLAAATGVSLDRVYSLIPENTHPVPVNWPPGE